MKAGCSSDKNSYFTRNPGTHKINKGNQWHFGIRRIMIFVLSPGLCTRCTVCRPTFMTCATQTLCLMSRRSRCLTAPTIKDAQTRRGRTSRKLACGIRPCKCLSLEKPSAAINSWINWIPIKREYALRWSTPLESSSVSANMARFTTLDWQNTARFKNLFFFPIGG